MMTDDFLVVAPTGRDADVTSPGGGLALGRTLLHSDSTELSRPILERAGLVRVTTTTPWTWRR